MKMDFAGGLRRWTHELLRLKEAFQDQSLYTVLP